MFINFAVVTRFLFDSAKLSYKFHTDKRLPKTQKLTSK